jgi:hypothetical protein
VEHEHAGQTVYTVRLCPLGTTNSCALVARMWHDELTETPC